MMQEMEKQIESYLRWLKEKIVLRQLDRDWIAISTPFIDRHNDCIDIYAKRDEDGYILTDDGYTINDLARSGCKIDSPKRQEILRTTLKGFGVNSNNDALEIKTSIDKFPQAKHNLLQAIAAVNDMFFLAAPTVTSLFLEDVSAWMDSNDIRFSQNITFIGQTSYTHNFDFIIPKSRKRPERIIRAINDPRRQTAQNFAFAWIDTREARPKEAIAYAILNDQDHHISKEVRNALASYSVKAIPWSKRDDYISDLAA